MRMGWATGRGGGASAPRMHAGRAQRLSAGAAPRWSGYWPLWAPGEGERAARKPAWATGPNRASWTGYGRDYHAAAFRCCMPVSRTTKYTAAPAAAISRASDTMYRMVASRTSPRVLAWLNC